MVTTSTIPTFKAALVTAIAAEVTCPVTYAWPGNETEPECVFLGQHPGLADPVTEAEQSVPVIAAGRQRRDEEYTVRVTVWTFGPDLTPQQAEDCEVRAFAIFAGVEDALADDPRVGLDPSVITHAAVTRAPSSLVPFQNGWACQIAADIGVRARLL